MFKKAIAIAVIACLSAGVGYAAGNGKNITVYYDTIKKIMIDGADKTQTDVKPFIYEGTTYVPLRYISEQLGKPVYYDHSTQIIYIGTRPKVATIEKSELFALPSNGVFNSSIYRYNNSVLPSDNLNLDAQWRYPADYKMSYRAASAGSTDDFETKDRGLNTKVYNGETLYYFNIGQGYDTLTGTIGYDGKLNPKIYPCTVNIIVDDVVRQRIVLNSINMMEAINANITGGKSLKIQLIVDNFSDAVNVTMEPFLNLTDMTLEKITYN